MALRLTFGLVGKTVEAMANWQPIPPRREKIFSVPGVVAGIVGLLLLIHGLRTVLTLEANAAILRLFAFVPGRFTFSINPDAVAAAFNQLAESDDGVKIELARFFFGDGSMQWWTPLTYAFLHGSWAHVVLNSLWFVAFGAALVRRIGTGRFLVFYAVTAIAGAALHYLTHQTDFSPVIGASAVVSGAMAAVTRFAFQPGEALGLFPRPGDEEKTYRPPAPPLNVILRDNRVLMFLGTWFFLNFVFGVISVPLAGEGGTVAWEAHVGGFLAGFLLFPLFDSAAKPSNQSG